MNQLFPKKEIIFNNYYPINCTTKSYTLSATLFSNLFSYKSCVTTEKTHYKPRTSMADNISKDDKQNISKSFYFPGNKTE